MNPAYFGLPMNMDRVCRICLTESTNLSPIFCSNQEVVQFSEISQKIQICGSIEIQEQDGLPSLICNDCIFKSSIAHEFRQLCQHSDARLRLYYNKPSKSNVMESSTQTDPQTRIVISKKSTNQENNYNVKEEELHIISEIQQSTEAFTHEQVSLNQNPITIHGEKMFDCNLRFEEPNKETERMTEDLAVAINETVINASVINANVIDPITESEIHPNSIHPNVISVDVVTENPLQIACSEGLIIPTDDKIDSTNKTDNRMDHYIDEQMLVESLEDQEETTTTTTTTPSKRTSNRKVKSIQNKTAFSDEEIDDDYYDQSSDSQDSLEPKFKCKICLKRYSTQKGLKKHSLVHDKKHNCDICLKTFCKLENLEKHKLIHATKPHACQLCHTSFSKPQSLVKHLKSHTEKVNDIIKQISDDPQELNEPKKEMKIEDDNDDDDQLLTGNNDTDDFQNTPELFKCEICGQYCSTKKNLKRHTLIHGEKKYSCYVCKKWFFRPDTLKKHAEKHGHGLLDNLIEDNKLFDSDDEPFPNTGGNIFGDNETAKKDESDEDGTGEYKCQHCDKILATKKGLRRHVSMHKPKAEPVTCEICKKVCASQARLLIHQKTHNKPKEKVPREYLCHICSKVYPSNSSLTYHMRTHSGVKPHVCKTCNSGFTTTTSLANHIRIHTGDKPFVCHVCSAAFAVSSAFRRHLTRHTGEANYLCKTCGKAFKRLSTLKEHTYTHSGEKPYVCKTCGAAYSHSGSLFAHQKRCRAQYGETMVVEEHHTVAHHIHVNNVQSAVRSLAVIGQMF